MLKHGKYFCPALYSFPFLLLLVEGLSVCMVDFLLKCIRSVILMILSGLRKYPIRECFVIYYGLILPLRQLAGLNLKEAVAMCLEVMFPAVF